MIAEFNHITFLLLTYESLVEQGFCNHQAEDPIGTFYPPPLATQQEVNEGRGGDKQNFICVYSLSSWLALLPDIVSNESPETMFET